MSRLLEFLTADIQDVNITSPRHQVARSGATLCTAEIERNMRDIYICLEVEVRRTK